MDLLARKSSQRGWCSSCTSDGSDTQHCVCRTLSWFCDWRRRWDRMAYPVQRSTNHSTVLQVVDCTDGNRFREVKPGEFFRAYSSAAYLPAFANADEGLAHGGGSAASVLAVEAVPQRAHSKRLADRAARRVDLGRDCSATVADCVVDVSGDAGSLGGGANSLPGVAPQHADEAAGQVNLQNQTASGCPLSAELAGGSPKLASPTVVAGCMALHAGDQSAAIAGHKRHPAQPQLHAGSKRSTTCEAANVCGPGCEPMHARAGAPRLACELLGRPDSAAQVPPEAHHTSAQQLKSPARQPEVTQLLQLRQGPGTAAAQHPASPRRLALRDDRSCSPKQSPAGRRGRVTGSQQQQQQHMLKLKDFPPAAEFSKLMARHNQVRHHVAAQALIGVICPACQPR